MAKLDNVIFLSWREMIEIQIDQSRIHVMNKVIFSFSI